MENNELFGIFDLENKQFIKTHVMRDQHPPNPCVLLDSNGYIWDTSAYIPTSGAVCLGKIGDGRYTLFMNRKTIGVNNDERSVATGVKSE